MFMCCVSQCQNCSTKACLLFSPAWKAQQRAHLHLTQYPYTGWPAKGYPVNRDQQQKRLLLKRLQWMRKYHLSRYFTQCTALSFKTALKTHICLKSDTACKFSTPTPKRQAFLNYFSRLRCSVVTHVCVM